MHEYVVKVQKGGNRNKQNNPRVTQNMCYMLHFKFEMKSKGNLF